MKTLQSILAALTLVITLGLISCDRSGDSDTDAAPPSPIDLKIASYEKVANEYVRVAKKLKDGDVSITVKYIELGAETKRSSAELAKEAPRMTPRQMQRVAEISARTAPYSQP